MKVSELIEKLQALPPDLNVIAINTDDIEVDPVEVFIGAMSPDETYRRFDELVEAAKADLSDDPEGLEEAIDELNMSQIAVIGCW